MPSTIPNVTLNNGVTMPIVGFGVLQIPDHETEVAVSAALEAGYRHLDTAAARSRRIRSSPAPTTRS